MPTQDIVVIDSIVRHMATNLIKLDAKVDELIDENQVMADKLDSAVNGLNAVVEINRKLGEQNELMRQELKAHGLLGTQEAPEE